MIAAPVEDSESEQRRLAGEVNGFMSLVSKDFKVGYRSDCDNLLESFYVPCLNESVVYRRSIGYFTTESVSVGSQGIACLIKRGCQVKVLAVPSIHGEDHEAIRAGNRGWGETIQDVLIRDLGDVKSQVVRSRLNAFAWLIREQQLQIKMVFPVDLDEVPRGAVCYQKMGLFSDRGGSTVAFMGSADEAAIDVPGTFEAIEVYCSWNDPHRRVLGKIVEFDRLWNNTTNGLAVQDFTAFVACLLEQYRTLTPPESDPAAVGSQPGASSDLSKGFRPPGSLTLRGYQVEAKKNWIRNNGRGILKMATGSGKTVTALSIAADLVRLINLKAVVIVCPYKHLVAQWEMECIRFGAYPILAFENRQKWSAVLSSQLYGSFDGSDSFLCVITTNATFAGNAFQKLLRVFPKKTLLIADEVHNLGATYWSSQLPSNVRLRLGLSATPERWFDDDGTEALTEYFGSVVEPEFTLSDALRSGALVPYRYHPIIVELTADEAEKYFVLSERIARLMAIGTESCEIAQDNPSLGALLSQRARLIATAENKLVALRELVRSRGDWRRTLFYCGDGMMSGDSGDGDEPAVCRQIDAVCSLLGNDLGLKVAAYTHRTPLEDRGDLRSQLDSGDLDGLVAIRCLDEGVDIPSIDKAVILASSQNPRQFIQRRGRVLRPAPGKFGAEIYDMIVTPPRSFLWSESERRMLQSELRRFSEFAALAENAGEARASMLEILDHFQLLDS